MRSFPLPIRHSNLLPQTVQLQGVSPLAGLEEKLQQLSKHPVAARRPKYEKMIAKYTRLEANQRPIDSHIRYNRFWQKAIAGEKARFDRLTRLHDDVLERQEIRDKLKKAPPADITIELRAREQALTDQITAQRDHGTPAPFLMVRQPHPNLWIVQVPLYTDIQDQKFLQEGKEAIERVWHIKDGDKEYRVQVLVKIVDPQDLYRPGLPPRVGAHIDVGAHVKHFPTDGGVLTTGANSTFAIPGRYVALPPQKIAKNVLAHEFGHILGLKDGYFRGYRNLGELGYEVLEIVLDPGDIMSAPGYGKVLPAHFDKLIAAQPGKALAGPPHSP